MPVTQDPALDRFAAYLRRAAIAAGYDIDTPRSGARNRLSADTGIPTSTISRTLNGETLPDIRRFQPLADALHIPVTDLLAEAGLITRSADGTPKTTPPPAETSVPSPQTPADAAIALGIPPEDRELFIAIVKRFTRPGDGKV